MYEYMQSVHDVFALLGLIPALQLQLFAETQTTLLNQPGNDLSPEMKTYYHDRLIDIDLLLCLAPDGTPVLIDKPDLKLPHPLMHLRDFVMRPLAEIAPDVLHPLLGKRLRDISCP